MNWLKNWDRIEPIDAWFKKIVPSNARRQHLIIELLDSFEMLDRGDVWAIGGLYTFAPLSDDAFDAFRGYLLLTQDDFGAILSASNPEIPLVDSDWLWLGESVNSLLILDTKKIHSSKFDLPGWNWEDFGVDYMQKELPTLWARFGDRYQS